MELYQVMQIIKKRVVLIILITLTCVIASAVLSFYVIKPVYQTSINVTIDDTRKTEDNTEVRENFGDINFYRSLVNTYKFYAKSRVVAKDIVTQLKLNKTPEAVMNMITVTSNADTQFLTITVKSNNAEEAMNIANQAAKSLKSITLNIKSVDLVQLFDDAALPKAPISPNPPKNIALAFLLGIMVSIGLILLLEYLDNTIKDPEELEKLTGLPVIGSIPLVENKKGSGAKK